MRDKLHGKIGEDRSKAKKTSDTKALNCEHLCIRGARKESRVMEQNELEREWASHSTYHVRYNRPGVLLRFLVSLSSMSTRAVLSSPLSAVVVAVPDT